MNDVNNVILCVPNDKGDEIFRVKCNMSKTFEDGMMKLSKSELMHLDFDIREVDREALICLEDKNKSKSNTNKFGLEMLGSFFTINNCTVKSIDYNRIKIKGELSLLFRNI